MKNWSLFTYHIFGGYELDMDITDVRIKLVENEGKLKGFANITIDGAFAVHDIKILAGETDLFIAMPSVKKKDGTFRDIAHPINQETRSYIQDIVLKSYNEELAKPKEA